MRMTGYWCGDCCLDVVIRQGEGYAGAKARHVQTCAPILFFSMSCPGVDWGSSR